ncbi:alkaline phosphatase family protein [Desulfatitalea alkaliphila]|uniref:Alkaline phosphatase family protein n=1 Tax=Desulfatitalea alkaliphila TaxID=2929485 RepID=A0AA41QZV8_9BACT|nr:alkaline phosphatase family protein [Desulfatitalea alkaliphila]
MKTDWNGKFGFLNKLRERLSIGGWSFRLLNRPQRIEKKENPGVILLKIDGLGYELFEKALAKKRLPFIRRLMQNASVSVKQFYSGMPSTTPAVQGELYYGVKTAVPAFEFFDREKAAVMTMYTPWAADATGHMLEKNGEPLLRGGTSYSNVYAAGANEARYCVQTMNMDSILRATNPIRLAAILFFHTGKILQMLAYAFLELLLAVTDFFRGLIEKQNIIKELKFIPTRIVICIVLRELIRFRVKLNIARGVRIVHASFLGYDEQAHRRGPDSLFALRTLKGIDEVIKDIYQTAEKYEGRQYHIFIYSDHGQERVRSYEQHAGKPIQTALGAILSTVGSIADISAPAFQEQPVSHHYQRALRLLGFRSRQRTNGENEAFSIQDIHITTKGPIGHIYFPAAMTDSQKTTIAEKLVREARVPMVLTLLGNRVNAFTRSGQFDLLTQYTLIFGDKREHPFARRVAADLGLLCRHSHAGDLVLSGWGRKDPPVSFAIENGAHGGPGSKETRSFVILPPVIHFPGDVLRPLDLRSQVMSLSDSSEFDGYAAK